MIKEKPFSTLWKAKPYTVLIGLALSLTGCTASPFENIVGYDVSSQTQAVPEEYPNVFTHISRDDTLKKPDAKTTTIRDLQAARQGHVEQKQRDIKAAGPST